MAPKLMQRLYDDGDRSGFGMLRSYFREHREGTAARLTWPSTA